MKKRFYVLFKVQIQGVGFRFTVMMKARDLNITGSIRNLDDGNVEAYFEGEESAIYNLLRDLYHISGFIRIDDYYMKEVPCVNDSNFKVIY